MSVHSSVTANHVMKWPFVRSLVLDAEIPVNTSVLEDVARHALFFARLWLKRFFCHVAIKCKR